MQNLQKDLIRNLDPTITMVSTRRRFLTSILLLDFLFHSTSFSAVNSNKPELFEWIESQTGGEIGPIEVQPSTIGAGLGLFARQNVKKGDVLFRIPHRCCMKYESALHSNPDFAFLGEEGGPAGKKLALACFMANEYRKTAPSFYRPYLELLPWIPEHQDHVLWSDDDLEELEENDEDALELALSLHRSVDYGAEVLRDADLLNAQDEDLRGAFVSIFSRSFNQGFDETVKMIPLLDMTQHGYPSNINHYSTPEGDVVGTALSDVDAGKEFYIDYGQNQMEPHEFRCFFGFVPRLC